MQEPTNKELGIKPNRGCLGLVITAVVIIELGLLIWWLV